MLGHILLTFLPMQARSHLEVAKVESARMAQLQAVNLGTGLVLDSMAVMRVGDLLKLSVAIQEA